METDAGTPDAREIIRRVVQHGYTDEIRGVLEDSDDYERAWRVQSPLQRFVYQGEGLPDILYDPAEENPEERLYVDPESAPVVIDTEDLEAGFRHIGEKLEGREDFVFRGKSDEPLDVPGDEQYPGSLALFYHPNDVDTLRYREAQRMAENYEHTGFDIQWVDGKVKFMDDEPEQWIEGQVRLIVDARNTPAELQDWLDQYFPPSKAYKMAMARKEDQWIRVLGDGFTSPVDER